MMEAITNRLASVAGLVAYVSVVVFPTLLLLFALSLDLLPTDLPGFVANFQTV
ncbi:hypothetical protein [Paracoccus binzhouensis]|uniref:hypothetical protein n=1 Tax=Paracoccus binzhouensis TaxID=2796149 RepID=UPI0018EF2870|nr:hypothetical protein [Paracoccus binzhouensis]